MWNLKFIQIKDQRKDQSIQKVHNKEWNFIILENCNYYHLVLTRFFVKSPSQSIKYRIVSTFIDKISSNRWMWILKFIRRRTQPRYQSVWKSKSSNMDRNEFNVVVIDDELKDRSIVGDEYGFFNLNQIPLTGLILILLTGQIFNIILNKILDSILKTIIYLREVNPSRQGSRQDFNRYHLIIKIIIKIIIFVIDII